MSKILFTGGPVPTYLDAVKILTNKFKGGLVAKYVQDLEQLESNHQITFLHHEDRHFTPTSNNTTVLTFKDFNDYKQKTLSLIRDMKVVVLGAAVANLMPDQTLYLEGKKFPSHQYKVGDKISIDFTITPRVINFIKDINPKCILVGFKLLSGVAEDELIKACKTLMEESKADFIIGNMAEHLEVKYILTKEGLVFSINHNELPRFFLSLLNSYHYQTIQKEEHFYLPQDKLNGFKQLVEENKYRLLYGQQKNGMYFGCIAQKYKWDKYPNAFLVSSRGKTDIQNCTLVTEVDHLNQKVFIPQSYPKASLNAPFLNTIFTENPHINSIVHWHDYPSDSKPILMFEYTIPGTTQDCRFLSLKSGNQFFIKGHGMFEVN